MTGTFGSNLPAMMNNLLVLVESKANKEMKDEEEESVITNSCKVDPRIVG